MDIDGCWFFCRTKNTDAYYKNQQVYPDGLYQCCQFNTHQTYSRASSPTSPHENLSCYLWYVFKPKLAIGKDPHHSRAAIRN